MIARPEYLEKIERCLGKQTIVVIVGQRRVGKSSILQMFCEKKRGQKEANVIFIDKEKNEFDSIRNYHDLNSYVESRLKKEKRNYILIDEVQDIEEFERALRSLYTEPNVDIIITGSNAKMLSSDISTLIAGRYKEILVQSLSYKEFLLFHNLSDSDDSLSLYLNYGGLPGLVRLGLEETAVREYQSDIYNTVLLKDVVKRNEIRNIVLLENLVRFVADNIGKQISANSIAKFLKGQNQPATLTPILNYLKYLASSYMIDKVIRYDIHGRRMFETNDKYYFSDVGIRNAIAGGTRDRDIEKVMENVVYNHLIRLGYKVYVGQLQNGEIDFICSKPDLARLYVQVSYIIADEATREREFGNLYNLKDNYPKYVISMTPLTNRTDNDGVIHLGLRRFLTQGL